MSAEGASCIRTSCGSAVAARRGRRSHRERCFLGVAAQLAAVG